MKMLICLFLFTTLNVSSTEVLTIEKQTEIVQKIAKTERRQLWQQGHQDIHSSVTYINQTKLGKLVEESKTAYDVLSNDEVNVLYNCLNSFPECSLFTIDITSDYMSGYGHDRIWILLNPLTGIADKTIKQSIYSE